MRLSHRTDRTARAVPRRAAAHGALAALLPALLLAACASPQPFSYLTGYRLSRTALNTYDTIIISVDGRSAASNARVMVDPGPHRILLQSRDGAGRSQLRSLDLDVAPCTRYWFEAVRDNRLTPDFVPRVNYAEPIGGCHPTATG